MSKPVHLKRTLEKTAERSLTLRRNLKKAKSKKTAPQGFLRELVVKQESGSPGRLQVKLTVSGTRTVSGLWCRIGGEWISLSRLTADASSAHEKSTETRTYRATMDFSEIHSAIRDHVVEARQDDSDLGAASGFRFRIYAEVSEALGKAPRYAAHVEKTDDELRYRYPLGRAANTEVSGLGQVDVGEDILTPYVNKVGFLSMLVNARLPQYTIIRNDGLEIVDGVLRIHGKIFTRNGELTETTMLLLGRTSGFRVQVPLEPVFDEENTSKRFGLRRYYFSANYDFADALQQGQASDDTADIYLDLVSRTSGAAYRRRVGRSRYLVRRHSSGSAVSKVGKTLSVTPYYTFKAKNPSLYLEVFDHETYKHLQRRLALPTRVLMRGKPKPIWVIGELPYKAQDNGLHFFRYMRDFHREIDAYYVIRPDSPERRNLEGYDNVLDYRSKEHIDMVLQADRIIGTHDPGFLYPIRSPEFEGKVKADKVFLQHGVTAAKWMVPNYGKNISAFKTDLILVCSEREKEFFVQDFGYSPREIAVTGFNRFDALFDGKVDLKPRQILIMPTWRPWLQDPDFFTESDYYQRWTELLQSSELAEMQRQNDAEIIFCLHPNMQQFSKHFEAEKIRVVVQGEVDVQYLMKESAAMVTDYSSVAFDFAFLDRPVVYYQFDAKRFAVPHADPLTEFPGPVVADQQGVLDELLQLLENDLQMEERYRDRASQFITYRTGSNNERAFEAIARLTVPRHPLHKILNGEMAVVATRVARRQKKYLPFMKKLYRLLRWLPLDKNTIVFESGQGKQFGDSPRAIYEELIRRGDTRKKVWIYDKALPIRDDYTVVHKRHSPGFFWHLARAKYWVNNHNFPHYIHRRRGGVYIQTWHGTPLKRMFLDQENFFGRDSGYKQRVLTASAQWSALLSPSPYATEAMRSSYAYRGPVFELGYPRNDVLLGDEAQSVRSRVRQRLGIAPGTRAILYAPTFRDDQPTKAGRFGFEWPFDPVLFHEKFGDDSVLLVRMHVLVSSKLRVPDEARESVINVSSHPDIQHLFLASDMLVTDYSSSFFDYSILGRPMAFFAYDLENYRDNLRGFYLDYETELPGPIVRTGEELFAAIEDSRTISAEESERIGVFAKRFAPQDDGQAAQRAVDRLL
ncbi:CDP-glycerol glycerophosphotransferase family protein [Arthrobacter rhombi]|uniref:CDP-glycerol glycerophosphotransferase family protein n=1 Tax=Arthrobacter rhombi TaxID=71253 RepID=UPI003FD0641A